MNIQYLFSMGGFGWYVWPAYCVTLFVFGINFMLSLREKNQVKKIIRKLEINKSS
jgi:heme exporter protein CcmD